MCMNMVGKGELLALFAGIGDEEIPGREGGLGKAQQIDWPDWNGKSVKRDKGSQV